MKEIDTESPVVWPAWCYSGNITTDLSKHSPITSASLSPSPSSSETGGNDSVSNKFHTRRKSQFTTKQLAVESVNGIQFGTDRNNLNSLQNLQHSTTTIPSLSSSSSLSASSLSAVISTLPISRHSPLTSSSSVAAAAAAAAASSSSIVQQLTINDNKMLSDRMLLGFNVIDNSNNKTKHCDNNSSYVYLEKVKNETQMDASNRDGESVINNNNHNNNNNNNNNSNNNNLSNNVNNLDSNSSNNNNNCVKRERLSPATNGDLQNLSRSRSATPSSFRGTPPQAINSNDVGIQNLSTNLLSSMQNRNNDFSTRNYSDFMRSLAAKYNNTNPNSSNASSRRKMFDSKASMQKGHNKDLASPTNEQKNSLPETSNPTVSPFVSTLLSSLPFSPIIDMSSTQALVTLARAAKEAELQNILRGAQKRSTTSSVHGNSPRSSNLTAALQQAAQFIAPSLSYSAQFQTPAHHTPSLHRQQPPSPKQSSTTATEKTTATTATTTTTTTTTASPLDLSSAPQTKRFKSESTSSSDRSPSQEPNQLPTALVHKSAKSPCNLSEPTTTAGPVNVGANLLRSCQSQSAEVNSWTVDEVCNFVASIDICAEYVQNFREQCIDGSGLPLLTEDHLMNSLRMKLGPALKLRSMLVKKLGGPCPCVSCTTQAQQILATQTAVTSSSTAAAAASSSSSQISPQQIPHHHQHNLLYGSSQITNQQHQYSHINQNSTNINNNNNNNNNNNSNSNNLSTCNSQLANSSVPRPASADSGS